MRDHTRDLSLFMFPVEVKTETRETKGLNTESVHQRPESVNVPCESQNRRLERPKDLIWRVYDRFACSLVLGLFGV